jgi:hypothetical protein
LIQDLSRFQYPRAFRDLSPPPVGTALVGGQSQFVQLVTWLLMASGVGCFGLFGAQVGQGVLFLGTTILQNGRVGISDLRGWVMTMIAVQPGVRVKSVPMRWCLSSYLCAMIMTTQLSFPHPPAKDTMSPEAVALMCLWLRCDHWAELL